MSQIRHLKKIAITLTLLCLIGILAMLQFAAPNSYARAQEEPLQPSGYSNIAFQNTNVDEHAIFYAYSGDTTKPGILFLHGTPGGWQAFDTYLANQQLQKDFFMVSADRLGWGNSAIAPKLINGEFELQARAIVAIMNLYPNKKWTIVGHSLGASMAPQVALMAPKSTHSLLLLAGSLNPKLGKPRWYNRAANTWVISRLIGRSMRYSNREIMGLRKQLENMTSKIQESRLDTKLVIMQGQKDRLVSPKNPEYAEQTWQPHFSSLDVIRLPQEGHFLPWKQTPLVIETIYSLWSNNISGI